MNEENKNIENLRERVRKLENEFIKFVVLIVLFFIFWFISELVPSYDREDWRIVVISIAIVFSSYYILRAIFKLIKFFAQSEEKKLKEEIFEEKEDPKLVVCTNCMLVYPGSYTKCLECETENKNLRRTEEKENS
ncbi:MAG: hypothetical protein V3V41_03370 [Candidatus Heimdallarchaeota archaeon]